MNFKSLFLISILLLHSTSFAVAYYFKVVRVQAKVHENGNYLEFSWPSYRCDELNIYRKAKMADSWGTPVATLDGDAMKFVDSTVSEGEAYEYFFERKKDSDKGYGYIYAGNKVPAVEFRGSVLIVMDSTYQKDLEPKMEQFHYDLIGDGWQVVRRSVSPEDSVTAVKRMIKEIYDENDDLKSVLLFGHVPVPYSGVIAPDGHSNHTGAWPADVYYADMDGQWTDSEQNFTASNDRLTNVPGDGKFDQSTIPSNLELQLGRVDFNGIGSSNDSIQIELYKLYLDKDHKYRHGEIDVQYRGLVDDNFSVSHQSEAFAFNGFHTSWILMGSRSARAGDFFTELGNENYLWAYGCGPGGNSSAGGVGDSRDFFKGDVKGVFTMLFGSGFGDWDNSNNFLRSPLASRPSILTCCWAGRPHWYFHHMGLGEPIGYSTLISQSSPSGLYWQNYPQRGVHVALMGDPTLRLHIIKPPSNLRMHKHSNGTTELRWDASADTVEGYYIYRAAHANERFERITTNMVTGTEFTDENPPSGNPVYMVRALWLEERNSGSYYNLSQGIFDSVPDPIVGAQLLRKNNHQSFVRTRLTKNVLNIHVHAMGDVPVHIRITDIAGRQLYFNALPQAKTAFEKVIRYTLPASGMYFVHILHGTRKTAHKILYYDK